MNKWSIKDLFICTLLEGLLWQYCAEMAIEEIKEKIENFADRMLDQPIGLELT